MGLTYIRGRHGRFKSKDQLVAAYLEQRGLARRELPQAALSAAEPTAQAQLAGRRRGDPAAG